MYIRYNLKDIDYISMTIYFAYFANYENHLDFEHIIMLFKNKSF